MWKKGPPKSRAHVEDECDDDGTKTTKVRRLKKLSIKEKLLKGTFMFVVNVYY